MSFPVTAPAGDDADPLDRLRVIRREQYAHLDQHGFLYDAPAADPDELGWAISEIVRLRGELAEARRIGMWLYDRLPPGARMALGDVSEWPWLLEKNNEEGS